MKFLIVGAGAMGGYFGARLLAAGQDVTFLLRPRRAAQLAQTGLVVRSRFGDLALPAPPYRLAAQLDTSYDVIIVGCKAYDLAQTMESFAAAVGPQTAILPLLNGMRHLELLAQRFGAARVLGGVCQISATLDAQGAILHLNDTHTLCFGETDGTLSARVRAMAAVMAGAGFEGKASTAMLQEMWEKWIFIASFAGATSFMRGSIGDIVAAGHADLPRRMLAEAAAIAAAHGFAPRAAMLEWAGALMSAAGSPLTASMAKDIEKGGAIEAEHIVGDLLARGDGKAPTLALAYAHLQTYQARRARETAAPA